MTDAVTQSGGEVVDRFGPKGFNTPRLRPRGRMSYPRPHVSPGQVAQSVEQWTENPRVGGSIPPLATNSPRRYEGDLSSLRSQLSENRDHESSSGTGDKA